MISNFTLDEFEAYKFWSTDTHNHDAVQNLFFFLNYYFDILPDKGVGLLIGGRREKWFYVWRTFQFGQFLCPSCDPAVVYVLAPADIKLDFKKEMKFRR